MVRISVKVSSVASSV